MELVWKDPTWDENENAFHILWALFRIFSLRYSRCCGVSFKLCTASAVEYISIIVKENSGVQTKLVVQLEHSYFVCVLVVTLCQKPPSNVMIYLCRTLIYHQIYICIYSFCYLPFPSSLYLLIQLIIYTDLDGDITISRKFSWSYPLVRCFTLLIQGHSVRMFSVREL